MKTLALVLILASGTAGQSAKPPAVGSWTAQFEGRTFLKLVLEAVNGTIGGGMSIGSIEVDKQGALRRVGDLPRTLTPIFDVTEQPALVTFSRKDGSDTDRFELHLLGAGRAELRFLLSDEDREALAADGVPAPKPIALTRQPPDGIPR
jgi:hypothetical protein